jgi:Rifampin ADP-ribosyl transferase
MGALDALHPGQFAPPKPRTFGSLFHGTTQEFKPGDIIKPSAQLGEGSSNFGRNATKAYATAHLPEAWNYAHQVTGGMPGLTPRVYHVEPIGDTSIENVGARRNQGYTNVASQQGFRVIGEAGAPKTMPAPVAPYPRSRFRPQTEDIGLGG